MGNSKTGFKRQLLLTTALIAPGFIAYGAREAHAACENTGPATYLCSGNETAAQTINANGAFVTMETGATVDSSATSSSAITISGDGNISFINTAGGAMTGSSVEGGSNGGYAGINIASNGGTATGSVTVNTTQSAVGFHGIRAYNNSVGVMTINAADATGADVYGYGINARNSSYGTDLSITTTGTVTGGRGIGANNSGTGALTINAVNATGTYDYGSGIYASNRGTNLSITTTGTITGGVGINARNNGTGALTINAVDVTAIYSGGAAIDAYNGRESTNLSITTTGAVTGGTGIRARNSGAGALTINAVDVTGTYAYGYGINARNSSDGTDLSVTTTGTVTGATGIQAGNSGSGALTINAVDATGSGDGGYGINAGNNGTSLSITATGTVSGVYGIRAVNNGTGALTINAVDVAGTYYHGIFGEAGAGGASITVTGDVTGAINGILLGSDGDTTITIAAGASVTGAQKSIDTTSDGKTSNDTINLAGTIAGDVALGGGADVLNLFDTASLGSSIIDGGNDSDTINLTGTGDGTLDGGLHSNFEVLQKSGAGTWTLTGINHFSTSAAFTAGTTELSGLLFSPEVTNSAILRVGGTANTASGIGSIGGNFTQTATGSLAIDVDADANTTDKLTASGTANLAGTVVPTVTGTLTDTETFTILTANGGVTDNGLTVADTVGYDFELLFEGNNVNLTVTEALTVVEALTSLGSSNQKQVTAYLNTLTDSGVASDEIKALIASLLALPDQASLQAALDKLVPSQLTGQIDTSVLANLTFANSMMSCGVSEGAFAVVREGECSWTKVTGRYKHHDATATALEFTERAGGIAGGMQFALGGEMRLGLALDYEKSETGIKGLAKADTDSAQGGIVLKNRWAGTSVAVAFSGGFAKTDASRFISVPTFTGVAKSDQDLKFAGVKLRASQLWSMGDWYLRPQVDLNATYVHVSGYTETGAGAFNLVVDGRSETIYSASPALEIGSEFRMDENTLVRPWVRAGATLFDDTSSTVLARFAGTPAGLGTLSFTSKTDKAFFDLSTGVNFLWDSGVELRLNYDGRFSKNSQEHSGGAKLGFKF